MSLVQAAGNSWKGRAKHITNLLYSTKHVRSPDWSENHRLHIRDLKIRRRRVSTTAAVSWGEWGEVAVVWREKLTLRSTVEEADGFITSFPGLSVF